MKRIITYDIVVGNDYSKLYQIIEKYNGIRITESTYLLDTSLNFDDFKRIIKSSVSANDKIYVISVNTENKLFYSKI